MNSWIELKAGAFIHYHCRTTQPQKNKFALVVAVETHAAMVFLINSALAEFILRRPDLLNQQVSLLPSEFDFLRHDSWLDCHDAHVLSSDDMTDLRHVGEAPAGLCIQVAKIAVASRTLNRRCKQAIASAFAHLSEPPRE